MIMAMSIKAARVNANLTQKQAADIIGVSADTICNWENGKNYPSTDKIPKILEAYGCELDDINFFSSKSSV